MHCRFLVAKILLGLRCGSNYFRLKQYFLSNENEERKTLTQVTFVEHVNIILYLVDSKLVLLVALGGVMTSKLVAMGCYTHKERQERLGDLNLRMRVPEKLGPRPHLNL